MLFRIARNRTGGEITHYDVYEIPVTRGMTVLDVLFKIQDEKDPTLSFRNSCRGAVCGSCAVLVNKMPMLACRTQVLRLRETKTDLTKFPALENTPSEWDPDAEILIEPLPNLSVLKDLVVDMTPFFNALKRMRLWTNPVEGDEPRRQSPDDRKLIDRYANCILCAICYGSCPVNARTTEYLGPAALAKAWRFYQGTRIEDRSRYLEAATISEGAPMCDLIMNCVRVCPKGVAPGGAIRRFKQVQWCSESNPLCRPSQPRSTTIQTKPACEVSHQSDVAIQSPLCEKPLQPAVESTEPDVQVQSCGVENIVNHVMMPKLIQSACHAEYPI
ncbi:MAG: succinate dehydrogenase/fumarate reductase iron-sulfur subunit [Candidatus Thorarchaeota archaeon]